MAEHNLYKMFSVVNFLVFLQICLADSTNDVTTIYRFDEPIAGTLKHQNPLHHILPSITIWKSSGWTETYNDRVGVNFPTEEERSFQTQANITVTLPLIWDSPFVVSCKGNPTKAYYVFFLTDEDVDVADLLVLLVTSSYIEVLTCKFLDGGDVYTFPVIQNRRCRDTGLRKPISYQVSYDVFQDFHFELIGNDVKIVSSFGARDVLLNIPFHYFEGMEYMCMGTEDRPGEFRFRRPEKLMALTKLRGNLELNLELEYNGGSYHTDTLCLVLHYYMDPWSGSEMQLSIVDHDGRRKALGAVSGEHRGGSWYVHRFLMKRPSEHYYYKSIRIEAHKKNNSPVLIHSLRGCLEEDTWNATTFTTPGSYDVHARTNGLGVPFLLHNGSVIDPNVEVDVPACPSAEMSCEWARDKWTTLDGNYLNISSPPLPLWSKKTIALETDGHNTTLAHPFLTALNMTFSVKWKETGETSFKIYLLDSKSIQSSNMYYIYIKEYYLNVYELHNSYGGSTCYLPNNSGTKNCRHICQRNSNLVWKQHYTFNVSVVLTPQYMDVLVENTRMGHVLHCRIQQSSFVYKPMQYYFIYTEKMAVRGASYLQEMYVQELNSDEGSFTSPLIFPLTSQLCVSLVYYLQGSATLSLTAERMNGEKLQLGTLNTTQEHGWQFRRFVSSHGFTEDNIPLQLILRATKSGTSRVLVQRIAGCHPQEDVTELGRQASLTVISPGIDSAFRSQDNFQYAGACLNGGVRSTRGTCACPPGFTGATCEEGCGPDRYGDDCGGRCSSSESQCRAMILCRPDWGCACAPGYTGFFCTQECDAGWYGAGCLQVCGHCGKGPCDRHTGTCRGGCQEGFHPPLCHEKCSHLVTSPRILRDGNETSLTVDLSEGNIQGKGSPYYYHIQYKSKEDPEWLTLQSALINSDKPVVTANVSALAAGSVYRVRAVIVNQDGNSYQGDSIPSAELATQCLVPEAVDYQLSCTHIEPDSFHVTWKAPPSRAEWCQVSRYQLFLKEGWRWFMYAETEAPSTSLNVSQRSPGERYAVRVRAVTTTGQPTPFSEPLPVTTPGLRGGAVKNFMVAAAEPTQITLTWQYRSLASDSVQHYVVSYECVKLLGCPASPCDHSQGQLQVRDPTATLRGLLPHAQYSLSVAAFSDSLGPATELQAITLPAGSVATPAVVPDAVFDRTNTSFSVRWAPPQNCSRLNGFLLGYQYQLRRAGEQVPVLEGSTSLTTTTFSLLTPLLRYEVDVFVVTNGGWDRNHPLTIAATTRATTPDKVTQLIVYKRSRRMLGIRWGAPTQTYGALESFTVTLAETAAPSKATRRVVKLASCPAWPQLFCFTVSKLRPDTEYMIMVQARNVEVAEDGEPVAVRATTHETAPAAPSHIRLLAQSSTSLSVQWGLPHLLNGVLRSFLVSVEEVDSHNATDCCQYYPIQELPVKAEKSSYQLEFTGLRPASSYTISVSGKTVALGPAVNITAPTKPPVPRFDAAPSVLLDENEETLSATLLPLAELQDLVKGYLLLLVPEPDEEDIPEATIWDDTLAGELRMAVNGPFYLAAEYSQVQLEANPTVTLQLNDGTADGIVGELSVPALSGGSIYRLGLVAVLEYQGTHSIGYRESEPFTRP